MSDDPHKGDNPANGDSRPDKQGQSEAKSEFESVSGVSSGSTSGITNVIEYVRDYLSFAQPAMILIFAAVSYIGAQIIGFLAIRIMVSARSTTVTTNGQVVDSGQGFAMFLAGIASLVEYGAGVLVIWAVARLLADALGKGHTHE